MRIFRFLSILRSTLPRVLPLMRDESVPRALKAGTIVTALLVISPLDLLGDIPVLGLVDDATLLALLAVLFVTLATSLRREPPEPREMRTVQPLPLSLRRPSGEN